MVIIALKETNTAKLLVETYNADVNLKDYKDDTALILAASTNNKTMVDFLLKKKASRYHTNKQGVSALMFASSLGNCGMVRSLYEEGYNLELCDSNGWTPLMFASLSGDTQTVTFLLCRGAAINVFSKDRVTPLIIAAANGKADVASLLLVRGALVNERDLIGRTALIHAAFNRQKNIMEILLKNQLTDHKFADIFKKTALIYTVIREDYESMKLLLQYNAHCSQGDINGTTPLMISACQGSTECIKTLLDLKIDVDESNVDGNTALHFGSSNGHSDAVSLLLKHNADPNKTNINGDTPLMMAAAKGHVSVMKNLLSSPAVDVNFHNSVERKSALMVAVGNNKQTIVKLLVQKGASVNESTVRGVTVLHISVIKGFVDVANYLMCATNINVNAETDLGVTPLHLGIHYERFELIRSLIEAGADVKKVTILKVDPLSYSIERNCVLALKIILQKCELSTKEKEMYLEYAKRIGSTAEISELILQAKTYEEIKTDTDSSVDTERKPHGTVGSSSLVDLKGVVTCLADITTEQTNLQIDSPNERNINIQGNIHNITINTNINTNVNLGSSTNCNIGDNNVINYTPEQN